MKRVRAILYRFTDRITGLLSAFLPGRTVVPRPRYRPLVRHHLRLRIAKAFIILLVLALGIVGAVQFTKRQYRTFQMPERAVTVKEEMPFRADSKESSDSTDKEPEQPRNYALVHPTNPPREWDDKTKQWRIIENPPSLTFPLLHESEPPLVKVK